MTTNANVAQKAARRKLNLLELAGEATPNLVVVAQADQLLMRNGMLVQALHEKEAELPAKLRKRQERYEFAKRHPGLLC